MTDNAIPLSYCQWVIMMNPGFITSNHFWQKSISCLTALEKYCTSFFWAGGVVLCLTVRTFGTQYAKTFLQPGSLIIAITAVFQSLLQHGIHICHGSHPESALQSWLWSLSSLPWLVSLCGACCQSFSPHKMTNPAYELTFVAFSPCTVFRHIWISVGVESSAVSFQSPPFSA